MDPTPKTLSPKALDLLQHRECTMQANATTCSNQDYNKLILG